MKYTVTVMEFVTPDSEDHSRNTWHHFTGRTLEEAWRICERHARRGVKRYGGSIRRGNWGLSGGRFAEAYRSCTIGVEGA